MGQYIYLPKYVIFSVCAVPFSVDLLGDCLNCNFYTLHNHTESHKKSWTKNIFSKIRKTFPKKSFWEKTKISDVFWKFKNSKFQNLQFLNFGGNGHFENFQHFEFQNFQKNIGKFYYFLKKYFFGKVFRIFEKIYFVQDFLCDSVWLCSV